MTKDSFSKARGNIIVAVLREMEIRYILDGNQDQKRTYVKYIKSLLISTKEYTQVVILKL
jgi:hypothetical protein